MGVAGYDVITVHVKSGIDIYLGFLLAFQGNTGIVHPLGHECFRPNYSSFIRIITDILILPRTQAEVG
jgi:hypothetical protein